MIWTLHLHEDMFPAVHLQGCKQKKDWKRYRIPIGFEKNNPLKSSRRQRFWKRKLHSLENTPNSQSPWKLDDCKMIQEPSEGWQIFQRLWGVHLFDFFLKAQNLARSLNSLWQNVVNSKVRRLWMKIKMYFSPKKIMMMYHCQPCWKFCRVHTRWPPISYKWSYNPYK